MQDGAGATFVLKLGILPAGRLCIALPHAGVAAAGR